MPASQAVRPASGCRPARRSCQRWDRSARRAAGAPLDRRTRVSTDLSCAAAARPRGPPRDAPRRDPASRSRAQLRRAAGAPAGRSPRSARRRGPGGPSVTRLRSPLTRKKTPRPTRPHGPLPADRARAPTWTNSAPVTRCTRSCPKPVTMMPVVAGAAHQRAAHGAPGRPAAMRTDAGHHREAALETQRAHQPLPPAACARRLVAPDEPSPLPSTVHPCGWPPRPTASASVVVSPSERPSATSRRRRRMILPERVLGRSGVKSRYLGRAMAPMTGRRGRAARAASSSLVAHAGARDDEGEDGLPGQRVVLADHGRLRDGRVVDERRLDLDGADAVAGDVHDVVHAAQQPEVAVVVALGAVAREVQAREAAPVGGLVALRVAVDAAQHAPARVA